MIHALYFNGLGNGRTRKRERLALRYLAKYGVQVEHVSVNWYASEQLNDLMGRLTTLAKRRLGEHDSLVLVGSSAGGSLALNVFKRVNDKRLSVVTLCSRLQETALAPWDRRTLPRMAGIGTTKASQLFVESVRYCTSTTVPSLTAADKQRITVVRQLADDVVPRPTMDIAGVQTHTVWAVGHGWGIAEAVRQLPAVLRQTQPILPGTVALAFWGVLLLSVYHLIRDVLQALSMDSAFTDIGHRSHQWCGAYCDEVTIPFDVLGIVVPVIVLRRGHVGRLGWLLVATLPFLILFALLP